MNIFIHTDGGARGNPGPAAVGVVIEECQMPNAKCQMIAGFGKRIGETTNNVAEYTAVIFALQELRSNPIIKSSTHPIIKCYSDSMLLVNQLNGLFKVKNAGLRELLMQIRQLEQEVGGSIQYFAIPREQNTRADFYVNQALDKSPHVG